MFWSFWAGVFRIVGVIGPFGLLGPFLICFTRLMQIQMFSFIFNMMLFLGGVYSVILYFV